MRKCVSAGLVFYFVTISGNAEYKDNLDMQIKIVDAEGTIVALDFDVKNYTSGNITIPNVKPWWPYLMNESPAYLYTMEVSTKQQPKNVPKPKNLFPLRSNYSTHQPVTS